MKKIAVLALIEGNLSDCNKCVIDHETNLCNSLDCEGGHFELVFPDSLSDEGSE